MQSSKWVVESSGKGAEVDKWVCIYTMLTKPKTHSRLFRIIHNFLIRKPLPSPCARIASRGLTNFNPVSIARTAGGRDAKPATRGLVKVGMPVIYVKRNVTINKLVAL
jgi:hypothetical protein